MREAKREREKSRESSKTLVIQDYKAKEGVRETRDIDLNARYDYTRGINKNKRKLGTDL